MQAKSLECYLLRRHIDDGTIVQQGEVVDYLTTDEAKRFTSGKSQSFTCPICVKEAQKEMDVLLIRLWEKDWTKEDENKLLDIDTVLTTLWEEEAARLD